MLKFHEIQIHPQVEAILALLKARASELSANVHVQVKPFQVDFECGYVIEIIGVNKYRLEEHKYLAIAISPRYDNSFILYHLFKGTFTTADQTPKEFWQNYDLYHFDKIYAVVGKVLTELRCAVAVHSI